MGSRTNRAGRGLIDEPGKHDVSNRYRKIFGSRLVQLSFVGAVAQRVIKTTDRLVHYSPDFLLESQATARPHYAYCLWVAADLARRLGLQRISAIEFGVAGGNGLAFMVDFSRRIAAATGVTIDCYGFDTGSGMPPPEDERDLPYWFQAEQYRMDQDALRKRLPEAKLVLGNIKDTVASFVAEHDPAPIGAIFNDTDYYSSTRESFRLFETAKTHPDHFLPRIPMYFDDVLGSWLEMYGEHNGQLAAIKDFNATAESVKINLNQNLISLPHLRYRYQIYYAHLFGHPRYSEYIGGQQQQELESALRLK